MRKLLMITTLSLLVSAACGDDDDTPAHGDHDHDAKSGTGGGSGTSSKAGSGGSAGRTSAGRGGSTSVAGGGGTGKAGTGGGGNGGAPNSNGESNITVRFKATVGNKDFACGTSYTDVGTKKTTVQASDFRFFVQDVKLIDESDKAVPVKLAVRAPWQSADVALLDFENGTGACGNGNTETNLEVTGTVPEGAYKAIEFSNGVPEALNHADPVTVADPLKTYASTSWGWLFGYRFLIAEVIADVEPSDGMDAGEAPQAWLHLGSSGCTNQAASDGGMDFEKPPISCARENRNLIRLDNYKVGESVIVADLAGIFADTDVSVTGGCHGQGDACVPLWKNVGLDSDGKLLTAQKVYRLE